ncbi:nucleotide exchange factor GrpE [Enterobacteriaceae endosymbiont of Donacia tomentosa]|uniref:nucleotide exchange factor GrpE n=1 Tax=Enterobacteriaceae endosymbiont of Donacia tomentosa TaxID=2675787 RepID=UPI001448BE53|nr:nucleotide exchange factor GrpE [Enterobacteriaceae endosymbiont of Donacia tomentosa]QJC31815.1 nucleotide exchange factor GrpE [Enterobacteriaceae endosymbiont of Donacia tomentosa]
MNDDKLLNNDEKKNQTELNNKLKKLNKNDDQKKKSDLGIYSKEQNIEYFKEKNSLYKLEISDLKDKIQKYKSDIWNLKLRSQAEIENIRHRSEIDIEKAYKFSLEKFISELLPVIDNLERAIELKIENNNIESSIIEGIKLTLKSFLNIITKFGISIINETNVLFDPSKHQAMSIIESDKIKENFIIEVLQKGYVLNNRLLRPAMVTVSKMKIKN